MQLAWKMAWWSWGTPPCIATRDTQGKAPTGRKWRRCRRWWAGWTTAEGWTDDTCDPEQPGGERREEPRPKAVAQGQRERWDNPGGVAGWARLSSHEQSWKMWKIAQADSHWKRLRVRASCSAWKPLWPVVGWEEDAPEVPRPSQSPAQVQQAQSPAGRNQPKDRVVQYQPSTVGSSDLYGHTIRNSFVLESLGQGVKVSVLG